MTMRLHALQSRLSEYDAVLLCSDKHNYSQHELYTELGSAHFRYLCGQYIKDVTVLILSQKIYLFASEPSDKEILWEGGRLTQSELQTMFMADAVYSPQDLAEKLPALLKTVRRLGFVFSEEKAWHLAQTYRSASVESFFDLGRQITKSRLRKDAQEIKSIQQACADTIAGFHALMQASPRVDNESQLEATFLHAILSRHSRCVAYPPIIACGENACTLHYNRNNAPLVEDALILVDAGASYNGYSADITRTFPRSGRFTSIQKEVYAIVLTAQKKGIETATAGAAIQAIQTAMLPILVQGLIDLKVLSGSCDSLIEQKAYLPYYPHSSGHHMGLEVHDAAYYDADDAGRMLDTDMVITVEPGLYFSTKNTKIPEPLRGIGIRIEDDIRITATNPEILTSNLAKEIDDIEHYMQQSD